MNSTPTTAELAAHHLHAIRGVEMGLGQDDPGVAIYTKLEAAHPGHLVLVQAGSFLHAYNRSAYALYVLKTYKLKLGGTINAPHIRAGMPVGGFKSRLWPMLDKFGIPYVVALGTQATGHTIYTSNAPTGNSHVLDAITPDVIHQVIEDLRQRGELNKAAAKQLLATPDTAGFQLKAQVIDFDTQILKDIAKMPRDLRSTYGENLRATTARITRGVMAYGLEENKPALLRQLSADVDLLKHYIAQAQKLSGLKAFNFEARATLAVELGRLVGGLIRSHQVQA